MKTDISAKRLTYEEYFRTTRDMWLGKFIGGTIGAPVEGYKRLLNVAIEDQFPLQIVENDDTDLQVLWIHALQTHGLDITASQMAEEWREHVRAPWSEYGIAVANWERGIAPPNSGKIDNWFFGNSMGCPIRSEIWGIICPGMPQIAARYARMDGSLDHDTDSIEAEVFLATIESALYFDKNLGELIETGLDQLDPTGRFATMVRKVLEWNAQNCWQDTRCLILKDYGSTDFSSGVLNMAFTVLALVGGKGDLIETLNIAINCGYDTDCNAASAGAIINAINGTDSLPSGIRDAISDTYKISDWLLGFPAEGRLDELTRASCQLGIEATQRYRSEIEIPIFIEDAALAPDLPPITVKPQRVAPIEPVANPFPTWEVIGPFSRDWTEALPQEIEFPDHGLPELPSIRYMTQGHSAFDQSHIPEEEVSLKGLSHIDLPTPLVQTIASSDSRLLLDEATHPISPATYYAYAAFDSPSDKQAWLLASATGPVKVWLNGKLEIESDSYQELNPTTFSTTTRLQAGTNRILFKLEKTSQPVQAFVQFKKHPNRHWHQCFIDTSLEWNPTPRNVDRKAH